MDEQLLQTMTAQILRRVRGTETNSPPPPTSLPLGSAPDLPHPSQERFAPLPGDLNELLEFLQAKACLFETDKPCDQCDRCQTRGF
ncbi:MAG: hypothetical protein K1Y36_06470 [Blastocatellia bacterium]|nr:hypothetical protein [Blastocatellia bacterium]